MKIKAVVLWMLLAVMMSLPLSALETDTQTVIPVSVSVTGNVAKPGFYTMTTLSHVSDAIRVADAKAAANPMLQSMLPAAEANLLTPLNIQSTADSEAVSYYGLRNVTLTRNGKKQTLDLLAFFRLGNLEHNPFLKDGDVIFVNAGQKVITLQGSVVKPGDYEFKPGDTVHKLLELALGVTDDAALNRVLLYRYKENFSDFDRSELDLRGYPDNAGSALDKALQPGDRLVVPANSEYRKAYRVSVNGKVKYPGLYYINDNTSLYDLMLLCGGPTQEADLHSSFVYNRNISDNSDPDFARLSRFAYSQMTWLEYSYLRTKTRQLKGKYSVSVEECWNTQGKEANPMLRDGDELYIPETLNGVWVAGQVRNPGLITWKSGMKWKDYVAASGGFANNRKQQGIRIIRVNSGNWIKPSDKISINPGDIIFIPDKEERYTWDYVKEAMLLVSQFLTILVAIRTF